MLSLNVFVRVQQTKIDMLKKGKIQCFSYIIVNADVAYNERRQSADARTLVKLLRKEGFNVGLTE